ncbi:MAG: universal stress protein [Proteobacteria bacterium]|nr:universal stress protein [Pseudomonadota bacterium]
MGIKSILLPSSSAMGNGSTALETAIWIAKSFGAHIDCVQFTDFPMSAALSGVDGTAVQEIMAAAQEEIAEASKIGEAACKKALMEQGVEFRDWPSADVRPTASWRMVQGSIHNEMATLGSVCDLVVARRPERSDSRDTMVVESALFDSQRPVLIAPPAVPEPLSAIPLKEWRVMIGWNQSSQSALAGTSALPFLQRAKAVQIYSIKTGAKVGASAEMFALYLARHGVDAKLREVEPDDRTVGQGLLAAAMEFNANLLVMGAYSHSRLRELILGGVTRHVLDNAGIPVLMSH